MNSPPPIPWQIGVTSVVRCPHCSGPAVIAWGVRKCSTCLRKQQPANDNGSALPDDLRRFRSVVREEVMR